MILRSFLNLKTKFFLHTKKREKKIEKKFQKFVEKEKNVFSQHLLEEIRLFSNTRVINLGLSGMMF